MIKERNSRIIKFRKKIFKNILDISFAAGINAAHIGGALSCVDIVSVLYSEILNLRKNKLFNLRDRFVLSKGHSCLALYAALIEKKFIEKKILEKTFEKNGSDFPGHPVINKKYGIEFSTGSLGMGLSLGIGMAIALEKKNSKSKTYVLLGDGECNEGSVWESLLFLSHNNLNNLTIVIDKNNFQQTGSTKEIQNNDLVKQVKNFNLDIYEIDGHNINEIYKIFKKPQKKSKLIIANTIKGNKINVFSNKNEWHHAVLTKEIYEKAMEEIDHV